MEVFHDYQGDSPRGTAVGIGNFDGVHLGHRRIIGCLQESFGPGTKTGIVTFTPHTRARPGGGGEDLLMTVDQRLDKLAELGVAFCWLCRFDREFSRMTAEEFIRRILMEKLGVAGICVGAGFRFGKGREGTVALLKEIGDEAGFGVREVPTVRIGRLQVSSSNIRKALRQGEAETASRMLGRDYRLTGEVIPGRGEGRRWGYPTANFQPEQLRPAFGVYAAEIEVKNEQFPGLLYLGSRPTFPEQGLKEPLAEAFLFDWKGKLYGRKLKVSLKKRLRGDIRFNNPEALVSQIRDDEFRARRIFAGSGPGLTKTKE